MRVIAGLPSWALNGPSIWAERLVRGLSDEGADARILLTEADSQNIRWPVTPGEVPADLRVDTLPSGDHDSWCQRWQSLVRYLEQQAPCIYVMSSDWRNNVVAPRLSNRVRLVGTVHADYELEYDQAARLGHHWNATVAVSEVLALRLAQRLPHLLPRVVTIPNGVPTQTGALVKPSAPPLRITYCGELRERQKRLGDVAHVIRELDERGVDFMMTFIGDGPLRSGLEAEMRPLVAEGRVRFLGTLSSRQVLEELARQHVLLLTSEYEGLSLALLEAMSRGCVPVVSDLSSQSLVVEEGRNGFRISVGDIGTYVDRLALIADDGDLRAKLANAARATIAGGYALDECVKRYRSLFDQLEGPQPVFGFQRMRGEMGPPPASVGGVPVLPELHSSEPICANAQPLWPEASKKPPRTERGQAIPGAPKEAHREHKVILSNPLGEISGVDVFCARLAAGLGDRGLEARVLVLGEPESDAKLELGRGVTVDRPAIPPYSTLQFRWRTLLRYLESHAPCFYIPNYEFEHASVVPRLSERVKVLTLAHSDDPLYYDLVTRIGPWSDAVVAVSHAIAEQITELAPIVEDRLRVIPYGVRVPDELPRQEREYPKLRIVYSGRLLTYQKRVQDIILIAEALNRRGIDFEFTVIGDGPEQEKLLNRGRELLMRRQLRFMGTVPNDVMPEVLAQADAYVSTSSFEGLSVGMLEAMAQGVVPVVSAVRSGVPDLIRPGVNGLVAPVGDVERFADHFVHLHEKPAARRAMGRVAYDTVSSAYRVEQMVERYTDLLKEVLATPVALRPGPVVPPEYLAREVSPRVRARRWLGMRVRAAQYRSAVARAERRRG